MTEIDQLRQRLSEVEAEREKWKGWLINATVALGREGGAFYEDVAGHIRVLLANYNALADAVAPTRRTPEDEELFDIAGLVRQAREDRALAMEYDSIVADQERMREAAFKAGYRATSATCDGQNWQFEGLEIDADTEQSAWTAFAALSTPRQP